MQSEPKENLSRRSFVTKLTTGAAGAAVLMSVTPQRSKAAYSDAAANGATLGADSDAEVAIGPVEPEAERLGSSDDVSSTPPPWELVRPLRTGSPVADGWQVKDLSGVVDGSCVLTLANARGRTNRLHICRNDGSPEGLVFTDQLDLVVMNGGRGDLPTEEGFGQAVAAVAHVLAANERGAGRVVNTLLSQKQREDKYAATARLR